MNEVGTYAELHLGQTIRRSRKEKGWTLQALAARLKISIAKLSAIETDRAVLDLELLVAIAEALGLQPDEMLPPSPSRHYLVTHHAEMGDLAPAPLNFVNDDGTVVRHANVLRPLADRFVGKHLEPFLIEIPPVADEDVRFVSHHQHEFLFVIRGRVECLLKTPEGLERETLGPGDCCYFLSHLPHAIRALGEEAAHGIDIVHAPYATAASELGDAAVYLKDGTSRGLTGRVAHQLTTLRQTHGMSTADFARELQLSVRQLADLERGHKPLSMDVLVRACRRFRKPLEYFMSTAVMNRPFWCVRRASEIPLLPPRPRRRLVDVSWSASEYRPLADDFGPREMFPYYLKLRLPPDYEDPPHAHLHEHHGQEFF
jgi:transcriptional regulator with XRE-family HTH domain/mannose-6-phosphate isomerase-like protein (cupin superfamily)